jgi:hypothetical protein
MDADEIDQPLLDQRHVLVRIDVELAHRDRRDAVLAQHGEVPVVLRRERVLEKEEPILIELLREPDRVHRRDPLVDVVQQLNLRAERRANVLEQLRHATDVCLG